MFHLEFLKLIESFIPGKIKPADLPTGTTFGVCNGFTDMWIQAFLTGLEQEDTLFDRIVMIRGFLERNEIENSTNTLKKEVDTLLERTVKDRTYIWSEFDYKLFEIKVFCENVALAQSPTSFDNVFEHRVYQSNSETFPIIQSKALEKQKIYTKNVGPIAVTLDELKQYLDDLTTAVSFCTERVCFKIQSTTHADAIYYNREKKTWHIIDINHFSEECEAGRFTNNTFTLAEDLFAAHFQEKYALFQIEPYSLSPQTDLINSLEIMRNKHYSVLKDQNVRLDSPCSQNILQLGISTSAELAVLKEILNWGNVDINHVDFRGYGPLHFACLTSRSDIVKLLLSLPNLDVNKKSNNGLSALHCASQEGNVDIVRELYSIEDLDENILSKEGNNAFYIACQEGNIEVVKFLLEKLPWTEINRSGITGATPFYMACQNGHFLIVRELMRSGKAHIQQRTNDNVSPLHKTCAFGHIEVLRELLSSPDVDINELCNGTTPFWIACGRGHASVVRILRKFPNININLAHPDINATPLHAACLRGHFSVVCELLDEPSLLINALSIEQDTALLVACMGGYVEIVRKLLEISGIEINRANIFGKTPLWVACEKGHKDIVVALLEQPDIDIYLASNGMTPLQAAENSPEIVTILTEYESRLLQAKSIEKSLTPQFESLKTKSSEHNPDLVCDIHSSSPMTAPNF